MVERLFGVALWLAGVGHFCLLAAGLQVPARFGWKQELPKLAPFNRKLMWTYYRFTGMTIIAFGTLTLLLHDELLRGDRAALGLAAFIGLFWTVRLLVDWLYYGHSDWPPGRAFAVGHVLLVALFLYLAGTYLGLFVWHLASRMSTAA